MSLTRPTVLELLPSFRVHLEAENKARRTVGALVRAFFDGWGGAA